MQKFKLTDEMIQFIEKEYSDNEVVKKILRAKNGNEFQVENQDQLEFLDFIEDESVYWMDENHEPSEKTYILEGIFDTIYMQTN